MTDEQLAELAGEFGLEWPGPAGTRLSPAEAAIMERVSRLAQEVYRLSGSSESTRIARYEAFIRWILSPLTADALVRSGCGEVIERAGLALYPPHGGDPQEPRED